MKPKSTRFQQGRPVWTAVLSWWTREELPSEELMAQIAVDRPIPISVPNTSSVSGPALSVSQMQHECEESDALGQ